METDMLCMLIKVVKQEMYRQGFKDVDYTTM